MKTVLLYVLVVCSLSASAQTWKQLSDFPAYARDDAATFVIGNKAYCGTGVVSWYATQRDFYSFDFNSENWTAISPLPKGANRQYANGFSSDSIAYLFGGFDSTFLNDLWAYYPNLDQWTLQPKLPATGRAGAASFVIGNNCYIVGGKTDISNALREVWTYNMSTAQWQQKNDLPFGNRWRSAAVTADNRGYLIGGMDDSLQFRNELYEYNPQQDKWKQISNFPQGGINYTQLYSIKNKLYLFGGMDSLKNYSNALWEYDIDKSAWRELDSLPGKGRRGGVGFQSDKAIYYTTGMLADGSRLKESWIYTVISSIDRNHFSEQQIQVYPNPFTVAFLINYSGSRKKECTFSIYNLEGVCVKKGTIGKTKTKVSLNRLSAGLYFIVFEQQGLRYSKKIVKRGF